MGRRTYVIAGVIALLPLFVLSGTAPLGDGWRYHELPKTTTMFACGFGLWMCFRSVRGMAIWVPLATAMFSLLYEFGGEYYALAKLHRTDAFGQETGLLWSNAVECVAPWLMGAIYGVLALLAIKPGKRPALGAGVWLAGVGAFAWYETLVNRDWKMSEYLFGEVHGTTGVAWEGLQKASAVTATIAVAAGIGLIATSLRKPPSPIPRAIVR